MSNRVQTLLHNLKAVRAVRPRDLVNMHHLVRPLSRSRRANNPGYLRQVAFEMFTRMDLEYTPPSGHAKRHDPPASSSQPPRGEPRVAVFVDAMDHLSGVSTTLNEWGGQARLRGHALDFYTCGGAELDRATVFAPEGTFRMSAYAGLSLHLPNAREVEEVFLRRKPDVIHLSTPGPMGLLGLGLSQKYDIPVCGTYHTDFPRYAMQLTGDPRLEATSWEFMRWFYGQLDQIASPSSSTRDDLSQNGLDASRIHVVGRGVHTGEFNPAHRSQAWRAQVAPHARHLLLYVGRISREKNLDCLIDMMRSLQRRRPDVALVITGDGPHLPALKQASIGLPVIFTGALHGAELSMVYASCDLFLFPSLTDTFGVVLIEAQASGLPALVGAQGGPRDAINNGVSGRVLEVMSPEELERNTIALLDNEALRSAMSKASLDHSQRFSPDASFQCFWDFNRLAWQTQRG